ncbi:MAG: HAD family hydrolase [Armatimonadetes bacterium]|nr:HAD family hydrolase [Armatimonadota bacterium]
MTQPHASRPVRAVFLDRDGVLNRDAPGFVTAPDGLHLLPRAGEAVARINGAGLKAILVTNQSGVGRGIMTEGALDAVHERLTESLAEAGGYLDAILRCTHAPWDGCECRKPRAGMLRAAERELGIDLTASYMIGDKPSDIECGASVGCTTVLVLSGLETEYDRATFSVKPDSVCADVWDAVEWILAREAP